MNPVGAASWAQALMMRSNEQSRKGKWGKRERQSKRKANKPTAGMLKSVDGIFFDCEIRWSSFIANIGSRQMKLAVGMGVEYCHRFGRRPTKQQKKANGNANDGWSMAMSDAKFDWLRRAMRLWAADRAMERLAALLYALLCALLCARAVHGDYLDSAIKGNRIVFCSSSGFFLFLPSCIGFWLMLTGFYLVLPSFT